MNKKPNIILFITHDQGQFLGCYNTPQTPNSLHTPNLDKLAKEGIRFTNNFCTAPQCSPSRGSMQTSLYPHQNGLMGLANRGWNLPDNNKTLPQYMKESGYTTHLVGLQHETNFPEKLGYDTMSKRTKDYKYNINKIEKDFLQFIEMHKADEKPFYANFGTIETHRPFRAWADPVNASNVKVPPFLPDHEMIRNDIAEFYGTIEKVDILIGKLIDKLYDTNLLEDTLFIYTTDHGSAFPRSKCTLYDPGIKTLLLMNLTSSELFSGGKIYDQMISNIDLLPTLVDLAGGKPPVNIEGNSVLPLLRGEIGEFRNRIFAEKTYHELYDPIRCIRTKNYKMIYNFEPLETLYQIPIDVLKDLSGQFMKDSYKNPRIPEELYDLESDPNETVNLAENPEYKDIIGTLKKDLFNWIKYTNDPILFGKIPKQESVSFTY
ncbi:MAG: sulfatase family protein [Promethearchaeota archaeon]